MSPDRIATAVLLGLVVVIQAKSCELGAALKKSDAEANLLRTEALELAVEAQGWETELVDATDDLETFLQDERDRGALLEDEKAELARQAKLLQGRIGVLADLYAGARGQIVEQDALVFASDTSTSAPDSVIAQLDDGLLTGRMAFFPPRSLDLEYAIELAIALGVVDTPDGRALVTAMSENPRVELRYGEVFYSPPPPVEYCSVWTRAGWGLGGLGVGMGVDAIKSILGG